MPAEAEGFEPDPAAVAEGLFPVSREPRRRNYIERVASFIGLLADDCAPELLCLYALLALTAGQGVTPENVHDAWSAWRTLLPIPDHSALVPFAELSPEVQALDQPYADAIQYTAMKLGLPAGKAVQAAETPADTEAPSGSPEPENGAEGRTEALAARIPEGFFGRVEMPGYRQDTGWITEETRFGQQMAVVRDWDGRETAAVAVGPACRVVYLPTPLKRPEQQEPRAITSGAPPSWRRTGTTLMTLPTTGRSDMGATVGETRAWLKAAYGIPDADDTHFVITALTGTARWVISCCDDAEEMATLLGGALGAVTGGQVTSLPGCVPVTASGGDVAEVLAGRDDDGAAPVCTAEAAGVAS